MRSDKDRLYVVVSASGKRFDDDNKITDLLLLVNAHIAYHVDCTQLLRDIEDRFVQIAVELGVKYPIREKFEEFYNGQFVQFYKASKAILRNMSEDEARALYEWLKERFEK